MSAKLWVTFYLCRVSVLVFPRYLLIMQLIYTSYLWGFLIVVWYEIGDFTLKYFSLSHVSLDTVVINNEDNNSHNPTLLTSLVLFDWETSGNFWQPMAWTWQPITPNCLRDLPVHCVTSTLCWLVSNNKYATSSSTLKKGIGNTWSSLEKDQGFS